MCVALLKQERTENGLVITSKRHQKKNTPKKCQKQLCGWLPKERESEVEQR